MNFRRVDRRRFLKTTAIAGAGLAMPTIFPSSSWAQDHCNAPTGSTVVFGFSVPLSGPYGDEGADQLRGYELAVRHINGEGDGGMLNTFKGSVLKGNGILGKKVEFVSGDSQALADAGRATANRMIERDGAIMVSGSVSSAEAIAVQSLCSDKGIIYMAGITHSNDTTGKDKRRNGFRHFFNAYMSGAALAPVIVEAYGADRRAYHITADYNWGWSQEESIVEATERLGWETAERVLTPLGTTDFSQWLTPVANSGADVLVLNHYGNDMANALTQAVQFGLRDRVVNGKNFEIVVPMFSDLNAQAAGEAVKGILGTANWMWKLEDEATKAFTRSFGQAYGQPPSQSAHTGYVQALLYANACEMAGTFHPEGVIEALEDFEFDGLGDGPTLYRAGDHQCFKQVLVVKGKEDPADRFDIQDVFKVVDVEHVMYEPDKWGGELGPIRSQC